MDKNKVTVHKTKISLKRTVYCISFLLTGMSVWGWWPVEEWYELVACRRMTG